MTHMATKYEKLFPTLISQGSLPKAASLNKRLAAGIHGLAEQDRAGKEWSKENYRGGYTSYATLTDLHYRTPDFAEFADQIQGPAEACAKALGWNMKGMDLELDSLWMNVMPKGTYHTLHLHPRSVLSGAYYVKCPPGSVALKLEDPRMGLYMNAPLRTGKAPGLYYEVEAKEGTFVLFESWLRHEVPPNRSREPRLSLSFNFSLLPRNQG